jgi:DNA replication protein DnaC
VRRIRGHKRGPDKDPDRWWDALLASNLPERYWGATVAAIGAGKVSGWVKAVLADAPQWLSEGRGFYICGPLNTGKSCIAALLLMDAVKRMETTLWLSVRDVPGARFRDTPKMADLDDRLRRCDLLVIDDLGSERFKRTGPAASALEETVRILYDRQRSVIVTSNFSWRQLDQEYAQFNAPLVSVLRRTVKPFEVLNDQWPLEPM